MDAATAYEMMVHPGAPVQPYAGDDSDSQTGGSHRLLKILVLLTLLVGIAVGAAFIVRNARIRNQKTGDGTGGTGGTGGTNGTDSPEETDPPTEPPTEPPEEPSPDPGDGQGGGGDGDDEDGEDGEDEEGGGVSAALAAGGIVVALFLGGAFALRRRSVKNMLKRNAAEIREEIIEEKDEAKERLGELKSLWDYAADDAAGDAAGDAAKHFDGGSNENNAVAGSHQEGDDAVAGSHQEDGDAVADSHQEGDDATKDDRASDDVTKDDNHTSDAAEDAEADSGAAKNGSQASGINASTEDAQAMADIREINKRLQNDLKREKDERNAEKKRLEEKAQEKIDAIDEALADFENKTNAEIRKLEAEKASLEEDLQNEMERLDGEIKEKEEQIEANNKLIGDLTKKRDELEAQNGEDVFKASDGKLFKVDDERNVVLDRNDKPVVIDRYKFTPRTVTVTKVPMSIPREANRVEYYFDGTKKDTTGLTELSINTVENDKGEEIREYELDSKELMDDLESMASITEIEKERDGLETIVIMGDGRLLTLEDFANELPGEIRNKFMTGTKTSPKFSNVNFGGGRGDVLLTPPNASDKVLNKDIKSWEKTEMGRLNESSIEYGKAARNLRSLLQELVKEQTELSNKYKDAIQNRLDNNESVELEKLSEDERQMHDKLEEAKKAVIEIKNLDTGTSQSEEIKAITKLVTTIDLFKMFELDKTLIKELEQQYESLKRGDRDDKKLQTLVNKFLKLDGGGLYTSFQARRPLPRRKVIGERPNGFKTESFPKKHTFNHLSTDEMIPLPKLKDWRNNKYLGKVLRVGRTDVPKKQVVKYKKNKEYDDVRNRDIEEENDGTDTYTRDPQFDDDIRDLNDQIAGLENDNTNLSGDIGGLEAVKSKARAEVQAEIKSKEKKQKAKEKAIADTKVKSEKKKEEAKRKTAGKLKLVKENYSKAKKRHTKAAREAGEAIKRAQVENEKQRREEAKQRGNSAAKRTKEDRKAKNERLARLRQNNKNARANVEI
jgi:hypothetical protein